MGFEHHHERGLEHERPDVDVQRESHERLQTVRLRISGKDLPRLRETLRRLYASEGGRRFSPERRELSRRSLDLSDRMDMERGELHRYEGNARSAVARPGDVERYLRAVENLRSLEAYRDRLQQQLASHIYPMQGGGQSFAPGTYPHGGGGPGLNFGPRGYPGNLLGGRSGWYHGGGFPGLFGRGGNLFGPERHLNPIAGRSGLYHGGFRRGGGGGFPNFQFPQLGGYPGIMGGLHRPFGNFGRQQYNWYSGFPAYEGGGGGGGGGPWLGNLGGGFTHKMGPGLVVPS